MRIVTQGYGIGILPGQQIITQGLDFIGGLKEVKALDSPITLIYSRESEINQIFSDRSPINTIVSKESKLDIVED